MLHRADPGGGSAQIAIEVVASFCARMHRHADIIIVGLGGMGSAAAAHASLRGKRVLGLEQFQPGHTHGSSHGRSRVIRLAYFEHPAYVPLLRRAYELWRQLGRDASRRVLQMTGGLMIGAPNSDVVSG